MIERNGGLMEDLIERARAIEIVHELQDSQTFDQTADMAYVLVDWAISEIPSAQSEKRTEERTETHACDLISRQAAIDALVGVTMFKTKHEIMQRVNASVQDEQGWLGAVAECLDEIEDLPSAQPEIIRCKACRWRDDYGHWLGCPVLNTDDDNFCSYAERKTDG